jgi:hypothetical protein
MKQSVFGQRSRMQNDTIFIAPSDDQEPLPLDFTTGATSFSSSSHLTLRAGS